MASVKKDKVFGDDNLKTQIKEAEGYATIIEGFFNEVFKQKPSAKQSIKNAELGTVWLCVAIIFAPKAFYAIGKRDTFDTECDECLTAKNPKSICIIESCLSSLGIKDEYITAIIEGFYAIRRMYKKNEGTLPLYDLDIVKENHLLNKDQLWNFDSNGGERIVEFIKSQL
jgi:hypothetical protein